MGKIYVITYTDLDDTEYHTDIIGYVLTEAAAKDICKRGGEYDYKEATPLEEN